MDRKQRGEDSTVWIGYADFLTTLSVLFFVLLVGVAAKSSPPRAGQLDGTIVDNANGAPIDLCYAQIGQERGDTSDISGKFSIRVDSLRSALNVGLTLACEGYRGFSKILSIAPGKTTTERIRMIREETVAMDVLPGDALFAQSMAVLKPEAINTIVQLGLKLKEGLSSSEVVAVQGHTDDIPFPASLGKDNWVLSGERAAAAAKVLSDPRYGVAIPECQIIIMGFGPSRPAIPLVAIDGFQERATKRTRNRRIEFRMVRGAAITGGGCGQ